MNNAREADEEIKVTDPLSSVLILAEQIENHIKEKYEPIDKLREFNQLLNDYHQQIYEKILEDQTGQLRKDFYTKVFKAVSDKMLNEKLIQNPQYLPQILRFFRNILVNYFPNNIDDELLAEVVHSLFNLEASLYTSALNSNIKARSTTTSSINQQMQENNSQDDEYTLEQKRVLSERLWRQELKEGDRVDCIKQRNINTYKISSWSQGVVQEVFSSDIDTLKISFDGDYYITNRIVNRFAAELAPLGTFTDDYQWRYDLKPGDVIDCLDSENVWYKSTCLEERIRTQDQKQIKEIYVGFRIYHEEGHKTDEIDGRKYTGWSQRYDEWKPITCSTIQRYGTMCKQYKIAGKQTMIYDHVVEDLNDVIFNNAERKCWTIYRLNHFANLKCIHDYLNEFGQRNGYTKILEFLSSQDPYRKVTLKHLYYIMDFLNKTQTLWQRQFACYYIPLLKDAFQSALLMSNSQQTGPLQQKFSRENVSQIQKSFHHILKRYYTTEYHLHVMAEIQISLGFILLNNDKLESRLAGFKEIIEQVKQTKFQYQTSKKQLSNKDLVRIFKEENIFEKIFGENYHIQIIQRSGELVRFMASEKELGEKEVDQIWQATKRDQQTKLEIYKILSDISMQLKSDETNELMIDKFATISPEDFVDKEIECIYELSRFAYKHCTYTAKVAELLYNVATQQKAYKKQIIELALDKLIELIRNWDLQTKQQFALLSIQNLQEHHSSVQSIKIIQKIIDQVPTYRVQTQPTQYDFTSQLIDNHDLIELVIQDINHYLQIANNLWETKIITEENCENIEILEQPFSHRQNIFIRLNFIRSLHSISLRRFDQSHLEQLWDSLILKSKIPIDSDIFFNWFKLILNDSNRLTPEILLHFFQSKVCSPDISFKFIKKAGFECISQLFLQINEHQDKLLFINQYQQFNNMNNPNPKLDFKIHVPPNELEGIKVIWRLLQDCNKKNNDLPTLVIDLITKIYHNLSSLIENKIHEIEDQFTHECLKLLKSVAYDDHFEASERKDMCQATVAMLKSFFDDSERRGTGFMKSHAALDRGEYLENIIINNNITRQKMCPKMLSVSTYSNMTIWELKKLIGKKIKISPLRIQINRTDPKKTIINDTHNLKMLRDFHIESYETLSIQQKPVINIPRAPLLNRQKQLMPEAKRIFESWFDMFSTPEGFMTPETCVGFIKNSTSDQTVTLNDQRITKLFKEFDKDGDNRISKEEFLEFYRSRSLEKPDLVWTNLSAHSIGPDLKPSMNNMYSEDDPNEIKDASDLPRYKLASDQDTFELLFELIDKLKGGQGSEELWQLMLNLRTNPQLYINLLVQSGLEEISQKKASVHKNLYCLQIIQTFVQEYSVKQDCSLKCFYENQQNDFPLINQPNNQQQSPQKVQNLNLAPLVINPISINGDDGGEIPMTDEEERDPPTPKIGAAIPLPANDNNVFSAKIGGNVPEPPSQYGPLPPPNVQSSNAASEKEKVIDMMRNFKGQCIEENFQNEFFSNQELQKFLPIDSSPSDLRIQWLPTFINIGNFKIFIDMLENLNQMVGNEKPEEILKSKSEKDSLFQLVKIIKTLLMATFSANSPDSDLLTQLTRKMSKDCNQIDQQDQQQQQLEDKKPNGEEQKKQGGKKDVKQQQEDIIKEYQPLIDLLSQNYGSSILENLDLKKFQKQMLSIIQIVLQKKGLLSLDDRHIIESTLSLWLSCVLFNAELLQIIYDEPIDLEQGKKNTISNIIIEEGLISNDNYIRECFKDALLFLCETIKSQSLTEQPLFYFLRLLIEKLNIVEQKSSQSRQYFCLLQELISKYFDHQKHQQMTFKQIFETNELLRMIIQKLRNYKSKEVKGTGIFSDHSLVGYIKLITELIRNNPQSLTDNEFKELMQEVVERCLFTFYNEPLECNITKDVNILEHEKPFLNKCEKSDSRESAYQLLLSICKIKPELINEIIDQYWHPLLFKVQKPKKAGFSPSSEGRSYHGYCGIKNLGCICYMNSMIQQFFHIPTFRYSIMAADDQENPNWTTYEGDQVDDNVLHQLMKFMSFLELSERQEYNPREFCYSFKDWDGNPINVRIQQDAQEFLNVAFDKIENMLSKTSQKYLLQNVFGGKTCSMMLCKSCGNLTQRFEDFFNLSLEVRNQKTVYESLQKFISGEIITDYQCEACKQKVEVEKRTVLEKLPNMLIIHLQRIYYDFETFNNQKLNSRVEFPNVLDLKPFILSEVMKKEKDNLKKIKKQQKKLAKTIAKTEQNNSSKMVVEDSKQEEEQPSEKLAENTIPSQVNEEQVSSDEEDSEMEIEEDLAVENFEYKLVGVVVHMGTADAGHYISFININRNSSNEGTAEWMKTENDKWIEFNDSQVKDYRFKNIEEDCYGGAQSSMSTSNDFKNDYSRNAYMLIYEKRKKEQIKIVVSPSLIDHSQSLSSLDYDSAAISRVNTVTPHIMIACPELKQKLSDENQIQYNQDLKEYFVLVDFNHIQKFIPQNYYHSVHEDNKLFLYEKHIFSNQFFKSTQEMLSIMIKEIPQLISSEESSFKMFDFMDRIVFDLLAMTSENRQLNDLTKLYLDLLQKNDKQLYNLISKRIMNFKVNENNKNKDEKTFFETLISSMDKDVREMCQQVLIYVVNRLFELGDLEQIDQIMNVVFGFLPEEASKNWLKIHQYLTFIYEVTRSGEEQLKYMTSRKVISKLIDFFLENESPLAIGIRRQQMGSNYANPPMENLILCISFIARNMPQIPEDFQAELDLNRYSPYYMKSFDHPIILSQEDLSMLTLKQFYAKSLKYGYSTLELGRLSAHISYDNYAFSNTVCKKILAGINRSNGDDVQQYLDVLRPILSINDSLKMYRLEWLLGIAVLKTEKPALYSMNNNQNKPKLGVSIIDHMNDEIYEYRSTLFRTQSSMKESLLQSMYQYRKRWSKQTLLILQCILQAANDEYQGSIYKYLKNLDPPTYSQARYIDWLKPYIKDTVESSLRNQNLTSYKQELVIALNVMTLYEELEKKYEPEAYNQQLKNQDQPIQINIKEQEQNILQHDPEEGGAEPYLIWNFIDEKIIDQRSIEEGLITVEVKELHVTISQSAPNGYKNLAIPKNYYNSSTFRSQYKEEMKRNIDNNEKNNSQQNYSIYRKPQFGRGQSGFGPIRGVSKYINSVTTRRRPNKKKGKKQIITSNPQTQQQDQGIPQDADVNIQDANQQENPMDIDYEENGQNNEPEEEEDYEDEEETNPSLNDHDQDGISNDNYAKPTDQDIYSTTASNNQNQDMLNEPTQASTGGSVPQFQGAQNSEYKEQDEINDEYWQAHSWAVLMFTVNNNDNMLQKKVSIRFKDTSSQEGGNPPNFKIPVSNIPTSILSKREKEVIVFTKLRPFDESWGNYEYEIQIDYPRSIINRAAPLPPNRDATFTVSSQPNRTSPQKEAQIFPSDPVGSGDYVANDQKQCRACTYLNDAFLSHCEICGGGLD